MGLWNYNTSNQKVTGMCSVGSDYSGESELTTDGSNFHFLFLSGVNCNAQAACEFGGTMSGAKLISEDSVTVDAEGGRLVRSFELTVESSSAIDGVATSRYEHDNGKRCQWTHEIVMRR